MNEKLARDAARQTFRQFAWNLAGTLSDKQKPPTRTKPASRPTRGASK
jgi:hypothetical protein